MTRSRPTAARSRPRRSPCPIAGALDLLGDRWTLLLIRDLLAGKQRYGEFQAAPEGIPTNILADRLARLAHAGVITSTPYQQNPPRYAYRLAPKGEDLRPVLSALAGWGLRHVAGTRVNPGVARALGSRGD